MGLLTRRKPGKPTGMSAFAPYPVAPYEPVAGVNNFAPLPNISPQTQTGLFPSHRPTQVPALPLGIMLKCGVEDLDRNYQVYTTGDLPYFLQVQRQTRGQGSTLATGNRPGPPAGPGTVSPLLGPGRVSRAQQISDLAAGLLGW